MAKYELKLPKMGESVAEATLTAWLKEVGDAIELDEPVVEIATDKVDSEVPSEVEGKLIERLFDVDDVVQVGQTIAIIEVDGEEGDTAEKDVEEDIVVAQAPDKEAPNAAAQSKESTGAAELEKNIEQVKQTTAPTISTTESDRFY